MNQYVILLRGVNVGGRIVKMADLKACLESAGLSDVQTYLQSGNVVCAGAMPAPALKELVEQTLSNNFGYPAKVIVLTLPQLQAIVAANPFSGAPSDYHQYVIFFENNLEKDFVNEAPRADYEDAQAGKGVVYWKVPKGQTLKSALAKTLAKPKYKTFNTNRNINTLQKMIA